MQNHGKSQGTLATQCTHRYVFRYAPYNLKVACEQRVFHLAPPLELGPPHLDVLLLHVDHQHFPLSVVPVIRIRRNTIYQKIM